MRLVDVIDNTTPQPGWHTEWIIENSELSPKIDRSTIVRFYLEHESLFFLKVYPKMIEKMINESFQKDSVVAMTSPVEMGIIDVFIQPPKEESIRMVSEQPDNYSI